MTHSHPFQELAVIPVADPWLQGGPILELGRSAQPDDQVWLCGTV
jgi:hypothetical protein